MDIYNDKLKDMIDSWIEENKENFIEDIIKFVNIKSVAKKEEGIYPYGVNCSKMLDKALNISEEYGFITENYEYHCGSCILEGKTNSKEIGIYTHLDVVPEGDGWEYEPYDATVKDGYIIGRGSRDNKGPAVASLYALRFLKENSIELDNRVKLFYGCCEEIGMPDIIYYVSNYKPSDVSLVPDAEYSVCYAEKGILEVDISRSLGKGNLRDFNAGEVSNVVAANAYAILEDVDYKSMVEIFKKYENIKLSDLGNKVKLIASGNSKHAAFPEGSTNAIEVLSSALKDSGVLKADSVDIVNFISGSLQDYNGRSLGIDYEDEISGKLTHISGLIKVVEDKLYMNYNIRYPVTIDQDKMLDRLTSTFYDNDFNIEKLDNNPPSYNSPDDPIIKLLSSISDRVLGKKYEPYVMGGGTYSRKLPNAFGFGMGIKDKELLFTGSRGNAHQPDECVNINDLVDGIKIYIYALLELDKHLKTYKDKGEE